MRWWNSWAPRKALPFVACCRPSRSWSYSPRSRRRHQHSSISDDSSDSTSSWSSRPSFSSRYRSRHQSRQHHRRQSSSLEEFSESPFSSCVTAPARHLVRRIRQGKFVKFDRLLPPVLDEVFIVQHSGVLELIDTYCVHSHSCAQADLRTFRRTRLLLHIWLAASGLAYGNLELKISQ